MKVLLLIVCVCIGVSRQNNFEKATDDFEDVLDKKAKECNDKFHFNRQQLDSMLKIAGDLPNDRNSKCYLTCLYIHLNIVDKSFTTLTDDVKIYLEVDEATAEIIYNKCKGLKGEDNCDKVFNAVNCIHNMLRNL
ncbi:hypothetical protein FQA39_LY13758 [Lamprigera yunnana]|nr:hypothetical protein FQA39_LY13758 [Lamprigera yunnana]